MADNSGSKIDFLQSEEWRKFQEAAGKRTFHLDLPHPNPLLKGEGEFGFWANIVEHTLPIIGKYFYVPRGPIMKLDPSALLGMTNIIDLAKKEKAGWIRFDPESGEILEILRNLDIDGNKLKITKAPHDMQPKEIFMIDISKSEEELLSEMKSKTRYNIKLAEKKEVRIVTSDNKQEINKKYIKELIRLVDLTANRKGVKFHPGEYYRKMIETIPGEILKIYIAEYNNKVIAANLVIFYENIAIYLHGATDDEFRNIMAPYLLQWQAIKDAKNAGCKFYDFGGVKTEISNSPNCLISNKIPNLNDQIDKNTKYKILDTKYNSWSGITKFKLGFSQIAKPIEFPGSYDIVISSFKYCLYKIFQLIKIFF